MKYFAELSSDYVPEESCNSTIEDKYTDELYISLHIPTANTVYWFVDSL
jgi:hypothetical protein